MFVFKLLYRGDFEDFEGVNVGFQSHAVRLKIKVSILDFFGVQTCRVFGNIGDVFEPVWRGMEGR